ncbi:Zinc finger, BED-type [Dillenia turbinata]|uniref:Zinc finger, BED-type n=1 Tax=Dillenia turbinata TaxID=194707 RepID=A0AAN8VA49_9MAGN
MSSLMADHEVEMAAASAVSTNATSEIKKRKTMKERLDVWEHFDKFIDAVGMSKSRCKYCSKEYKSNSKTCGTSTLKTHLLKCSKYPFSELNKGNDNQIELNFKMGDDSKKYTLMNWKFDYDDARLALAKMIVVDELHFSFVENEGFKHFISVIQPKMHWLARTTIATIQR